MSFLNKFKYHYHVKNVDTLIRQEKYDEFFDYLENLNHNKNMFYEISLKYISKSIKAYNKDVTNKKIIWINSFLRDDCKYLNSFITYYSKNYEPLAQNVNSYKSEIDLLVTKKEEINFNVLVNHSYFFQWMILNNTKCKFKFLENDIPFFSSENNYNFTKQNLSQAYIIILNNPYKVYSKIKKSNNNQPEIARNIFLNLDQRANDELYKNVNFKFSNKGWRVHTESWTDANVIDSLRGKIISKKELCNNTFETLSSVILHLIQSGAQMELNYNLIEKFIESNEPPQYQEIFDISNKEKKFLNKHVDDILTTFDI